MKNTTYIAPRTEAYHLNAENIMILTSRHVEDAVEDRHIYKEEHNIIIYNEGGDDRTADTKHRSLWDEDEEDW